MTKTTDLVKGLMGSILPNHAQTIENQKKASQSQYGFKGHPSWNIPFLSPKQLADQLCISEKTLERMRKDGSGPPYIRTGSKRIRYPIQGLDAWVEARLQSTTPPNQSFHSSKEDE